jgi:hypothetical protein
MAVWNIGLPHCLLDEEVKIDMMQTDSRIKLGGKNPIHLRDAPLLTWSHDGTACTTQTPREVFGEKCTRTGTVDWPGRNDRG